MTRWIKPLPVFLLLALSLVEGVSCGLKESGDSGGTGSGSAAVCPTPSESAALKSSSWNQSLSLTSGGTSVSGREISVALTATNSTGINAYWLSEDDSTPVAGDSGWVTVDQTAALSTSASFTLSETDGSKTLYGWFKDTTDEVSPVACLSVTLDTGLPSGTISLDSGASTTGDLTVSAVITGTSSNSPIVGYALSETNSTPATDSSLWNTIAAPSTSVTVSTNFSLSATPGAHTVYGWIKTETGMISASFSASITFTLPTVASGAAPVVQEGLTVNANSTLTAGLTINSGSTSTTSRTVSLTLSGLGTATISQYEVSESSSPASYTAVSSPSTSLQSTVNYQSTTVPRRFICT